MLNIKKTPSIDHNCHIYRITIKQNGIMIYDQTSATPYYFPSNGLNIWSFLTPFNMSQNPPTANLNLEVCFYGENNNWICCKQISDYCTLSVVPEQGGANSVNEEQITNQKSFGDIKISPIPAQDYLQIDMKPNEEINLKIELVNSLGIVIYNNYFGSVEINRPWRTNISTSKIIDGNYFIKFIDLLSGKSIVYPFIISK